MKITSALLTLLLGLMVSMPLNAAEMEDQPYAVLRRLDKVTGRVSSVTVPVGQESLFETLSIQVHTCRLSVPPDPPEAAVFLEITDRPKGRGEAFRAFGGWMFASSPALSAMEHPLYDVWLIACRDKPQDDSQKAAPKTVPMIDAAPAQGVLD